MLFLHYKRRGRQWTVVLLSMLSVVFGSRKNEIRCPMSLYRFKVQHQQKIKQLKKTTHLNAIALKRINPIRLKRLQFIHPFRWMILKKEKTLLNKKKAPR